MRANFGKYQNGYAYAALCLPVIVFASYIFRHAVNIPYMDDMELVDSVNVLKKNMSYFFSVLVRQQNDHRSAFPRIGIFITYLLKGTLDFRLTILLGYLNLILLGYTFYLIYKSASGGIISFLPVTLLLFSPIVYQVHLWSLTAFQHTLSIAFSLLCLYFLQERKHEIWYYAILFAIIAGLTNLDGITVIPVALVWLITQKRWKHTAIFLAFGVVYLIIYFSDFKFGSDSKPGFDGSSIVSIAKCFATGTGSLAKIISDTHGVMLSFIAGCFILITFVTLKLFPRINSRARFSPANLFELDFTDICFLKLLTSMATIAIGRYDTGIDAMIAIRFQVYAVSVAILFYLFMIKTLKNRSLRVFKILFLLVAFMLGGYSYKKYESAVTYLEQGLIADSYNYPQHHVFLHQYFNMPDAKPEFYINYKFPEYFSEKTIQAWKRRSTSVPANAKIVSEDFPPGARGGDYVFPIKILQIDNQDQDLSGKDLYLGLTSDAIPDLFYLVALKDDNRSLANRLLRRPLSGNYHSEIPEKLLSGSYSARFCWVQNGKPFSREIKNSLVFKKSEALE
jgi:hypothetical protein